MKICIDAGHGLHTSGKRCLKSIDPNETREWTLNSRVAGYVVEHLNRCGAEVLRTDDATGETDVALSGRTGKANSWGADYFVSIHHNAGINGGSGGGAVVFVYNGAHSAKSDQLQKNVYDGLIGETGKFGNRANPLSSSNLYVLRHTSMPAVLVECGFMDSTVDTPMILTDAFARTAAKGISRGVCQTAGLAFVEEGAAEDAPASDSSGGLYRVRRSWEDADSQLGAFSVLENAKALADANPGYAVFDEAGTVVYTAAAGEAAPEGSGNDAASEEKLTTIAAIQRWAGATADGIYGPKTKAAVVKAAQRAVGTAADGIWGSKSRACWSNVKEGGRGDAVRAMQAMLICRGYSCGDWGADGICGGGTVAAVKAFQRAVSLTVDGICGKNTADKLFK